MIAVVVMTDGRRHCIERAIPSLRQHLHGPITRWVINDDSADPDYYGWLDETFPVDDLLVTQPRRGFGGAYQRAWEHLSTIPERFVFSTEDDFLLTRPVDLQAMADVLDENPCLVQLALRRQPWNAEEVAAGGIVEQHPDDYREMFDHAHRHWLEHRRFFTTNPSLFRTELCEKGWPNVEHSEGQFTHRLLLDVEAQFGFWGARDSGEWVEHIGHERVGTGY